MHPRSSATAVAVSLCVCTLHAACRRSTEARHEHVLDLPPVGPSVAVRLDGSSVDVPLSTIASGTSGVSLDSVWRAAWPHEDPLHLRFDLVGSDGFRPMSRPKCTRLLTGSEFVRAHLDAVSHDVTFDEEPELPGCYRVHHVVAIEASR
jgi:hypothetical protein